MKVTYFLPNKAGSFCENDINIPKNGVTIKCGLKEYTISDVLTFGNMNSGGKSVITEVVCYLGEVHENS